MGKVNWQGLIQTVKSAVTKHSAGILTGLGIGGMVTTTVLAVRATPKAIVCIEERKREDGVDKLPMWDTVKCTWKCYIPPVITGVLSTGCLIGSNTVSERRNAALATAYSLSESALTTYRDKVVETVGETKEKAIRDKVTEQTIADNPVGSRDILVTGHGSTLCYDGVSGRYFYSDRGKLEKAENEINRRLRDEMTISLNEFYDEIGIGHIGVGDDLGWNIDKGYMDIFFSAQLTEDGKTPCIVMDYGVLPDYNYR